MKSPNIAGFVGHEGEPVWVEPSQSYEDDAALVLAQPGLFGVDVSASYEDAEPEQEPEPEQEQEQAKQEPVRRGPGRPKGSANKPHTVD